MDCLTPAAFNAVWADFVPALVSMINAVIVVSWFAGAAGWLLTSMAYPWLRTVRRARRRVRLQRGQA